MKLESAGVLKKRPLMSLTTEKLFSSNHLYSRPQHYERLTSLYSKAFFKATCIHYIV